ncbi:MAG: WG repeat-containing protein [Bacteroidia bacterium]|nr:WG repeat-containing protein [Bacteroidia bacterium]NNJ54538.1 hypothetical protein [Bacteroidia bacterium]
MRWLLIILLFVGLSSWAQKRSVKKHPNNRKYAITLNDSTFLSDYEYSEVSEWSESKAYIAKGDLYAYIDSNLNELSPYVFAEANNFNKGYAIVGDSFNRSVITKNMHMVMPFIFDEVRLPDKGLILVKSHEGLWGAYDTMGNQKLPVIYDLPPQILTLERIIVRKNELYGVVNDCNETVFNCNYQYISSDGLGYKSGKYLVLFEGS